MRVIIGTKKEMFELTDVKWIIIDKMDLEIHTDGQMAVIEEVKEDER